MFRSRPLTLVAATASRPAKGFKREGYDEHSELPTVVLANPAAQNRDQSHHLVADDPRPTRAASDPDLTWPGGLARV